jgi:hypothetical protein
VNLTVERAHHIVDDLSQARSRRAFLSALDHFERMLALAPDYPPGCVTEADCEQLSALADIIVTHIEDRLDRHTDRPSIQRALAAKVYEIRNRLETLYTITHDNAGSAAHGSRTGYFASAGKEQRLPLTPPTFARAARGGQQGLNAASSAGTGLPGHAAAALRNR